MGRPTLYNDDLAAKICDTIATSNKGLRKIASENDISMTSILKWLKENREFASQYAHARELQADLLADEIIEISDSEIELTETIKGKDGQITMTAHKDNVQRARLMVDSRKWIASKLKPKKYGDANNTQHPPTEPINYEDFIKKINEA